MSTRRVLSVLALTAAVTLSGCAGDEDESTTGAADNTPVVAADDAASASTATNEAAGETAGDAAGQTQAPVTDATRDELVELTDEEGARADLSAFSCKATDGVWGATGTLTNSTDEDQTYYVRIGVIETGESRSSVAWKNVVEELAAGESEEFTADSIVTTDRTDLECLARVVRGTGSENG